MSVYLSSGAFRTRYLPDIVENARLLGVRHVELSSGVDHMPAFDAYIPKLKRSGLNLLVHNYFPAPARPFVLNLGALDAGVLEQSREHVKRCLALSADLGAAYYSVHSAFVLGMNADMLGKPDQQATVEQRLGPEQREKSLEVFVESLRMLTQDAAELGLDLLVENNVVSPHYMQLRGVDPFLMTTAAEIKIVLDAVAAPNLHLLLDVAHARVSATALGFDAGEFIEQVRPCIKALHLSDNNGHEDENLPVHEDSWFWPHLKGLGAVDAVIEAYSIDDATILAQISLTRRKLEALN
jgi:sugar phosphate isomerase/epimerase